MKSIPGKIHLDDLFTLCKSGATNSDICEILQCEPVALEPFSTDLKRARAERRLELRRQQTELALSGNAEMLRILGEQELIETQKPDPSADEPDMDKYPNTGFPPGHPSGRLQELRQEAALDWVNHFIKTAFIYERMNGEQVTRGFLKQIGGWHGIDVDERAEWYFAHSTSQKPQNPASDEPQEFLPTTADEHLEQVAQTRANRTGQPVTIYNETPGGVVAVQRDPEKPIG
jgi:hypothetical protein